MSKVLPAVTQADLQPWQTPLMGNDEAGSADGRPCTVQELAALEAQARQQGFETGRLEGLQAGEAEIKACIDRFQKLLNNMADPFEQVEQNVQEQLVLLAGAIAEKLVRRELSLDPEAILETIHEAIRSLSADASRINLRLHPDDMALVNQQLDATSIERHWTLVEDPHLQRGECLIESDLEFIDASTSARVNSILTQLLDIDPAKLAQ